MIVVTRLNDSQFAVNPDLIERIHETPDTTLVMVDGAKYIVTEPLTEVIDLIAAHRARIISLARHLPAEQAGGLAPHRSLGLVREPGADEPAGTPHHSDGGGTPVQLRPRNA
ncbi:flagellar FlbD family protein [Arthrobacter sp. RIT-PI-e]|uniref:flagellar FlbD family protein n=1 Tax=Arthrobacter sp. RIT-PI-e TaxID=1681197 RepID=UPI0009E65922|nr:flagellar FlbD family protein [Arthrobacter sp. RIT-PI-e]